MGITHNHQSEYQHWQPAMTKIIDGKPVRFRDVCVQEIKIADIEDPVMFVAEPIYHWQQTDAGKFIMEHAEEKPYWTHSVDYTSYGHVYRIMARISEQTETFWRLKWGGLNK